MRTATVAYRRSTRMAPSGRMVSSPVAVPAISTYAHFGRAGATVCAAVAIVTSSKTPQPRHWMMFAAVGRYDSRAPNSPRSSTMAGAPVSAPGRPASASAVVPSRVPATIAVSAAARESSGVPAPPGCSTKTAPVKPSRLTPRLPQSPNWSDRLSACGTGSASVRATSAWRSPGTVTKVSFAELEVVADMAASLRRHYPDRFRRSAARSAALSARLARAPVCIQFTSILLLLTLLTRLRVDLVVQHGPGVGDLGVELVARLLVGEVLRVFRQVLDLVLANELFCVVEDAHVETPISVTCNDLRLALSCTGTDATLRSDKFLSYSERTAAYAVRRAARTKFLMSAAPCAVRMDSGWNWTPST